MSRRKTTYKSNRKPSLNSIVERPDPKAAKQSSKTTQAKLDRVQRKLEDKDPSDPGYERLMRRAERLQNAL